MSEQKNYIPLLSEFKSAIDGGFVTDMSQVRGGAELSANAIQKVDFNKEQNKILFYNSKAEGASPVTSIDVSSFVSGGLLKAVTLNDSILTMTFSLSGGDQTVEIPLESIFSPDNYYSKTDINRMLNRIPILRFHNISSNYTEIVYHKSPEFYDQTTLDVTFYTYNGATKFYGYSIECSDDQLNNILHLYDIETLQYNKPDGIPFSDKVYAAHDGKLYLYDADNEKLMPLSISGIRHICKNNEDEGNTDLSGLIDRLEALEEHNFPISISTSFSPTSGSFDGTTKSVTVNASFKKGNDKYTPAKVKIYQRINSSFAPIYEDTAPTTNNVQYTVSGITSMSTSFKIDITTAEGAVISSGEKTFYVYPPLYVGFAPSDTDFSDIKAAATDNGFNKYYSSAFPKNLTLENLVDGVDIFVLLPSKTLSKFIYSTMSLETKFDKLAGTFTYKTDIGNISYNVYRSQTGGKITATTLTNVNITL